MTPQQLKACREAFEKACCITDPQPCIPFDPFQKEDDGRYRNAWTDAEFRGFRACWERHVLPSSDVTDTNFHP